MLFHKQGQIAFDEILHGTAMGRKQSVGCMEVVPLLGDEGNGDFIAPTSDRVEVGTSDYGSLSFWNCSESVLIVPCHTGFVVDRGAQDHAMAHAALLKPGKRRTFDTAMCIQQCQGGLIHRGRYRMTILPFALREPALVLRRKRNFEKLWQPIAEFNAHMGIEGPGHLVFFLRRFRKQLDQFVAEFERVPRQVGALILVGGKVVGIERTPSVSYWEAVWSCLIRECYGSLAVQMARNGHASRLPGTRLPLPESITSLDELSSALTAIDAEEERRVAAKISVLGDESFSTTPEEKVNGLRLETLRHRGFVGQLVRDGDRVVYASIIASKDGKKARP